MKTRLSSDAEQEEMEKMYMDLVKTFASRIGKIIDARGPEFLSRNIMSSMILNFAGVTIAALPTGGEEDKEEVLRRTLGGLEMIMRRQWEKD